MRITDLKEHEFNFFYATYLNALGKEVDLTTALINGRDNFELLVNSLTNEQLLYSYGEGKWSVAEVLVHLIDTERIFQYRAFRISRNDKTPLPGFDQDDFVAESKSNGRSKNDILMEYLAVRNSTIQLFKGMTENVLKRTGVASTMPWSVAAIGLAISGHQKHHESILKERYLRY